MNTDYMMSDFLSISNIIVSLATFGLFITYRGRLFEQNMLERIGLNVMAIAAFIIAYKTSVNLANGVLKFDYYGLLFRFGYLLHLCGVIQAIHTVGAAVAAKTPKAEVLIRQPMESEHEMHLV